MKRLQSEKESIIDLQRYIDKLYLAGQYEALEELTKDPRQHVRVMAKNSLELVKRKEDRRGR